MVLFEPKNDIIMVHGSVIIFRFITCTNAASAHTCSCDGETPPVQFCVCNDSNKLHFQEMTDLLDITKLYLSTQETVKTE